MQKRTSVFLAVLAIAVLSSAVVGVEVSAQSPQQRNAQAAPQPQQANGTVPLNVTTRVFDKKALLAAPVLTDEQQAGRALWVQRCAYCHDGLGQPSYHTLGDWIGAETVQSLGEDAMKAFINTGTTRMPSFKYDLDSKQLDDLIAFIKTVPSSEKPTAAQLAGKVAGAEGGSD